MKSALSLALLLFLTRGNVSLLPQDIILQHYFYFIDLTWSSTEWDRKLHLKDKWKKEIWRMHCILDSKLTAVITICYAEHLGYIFAKNPISP